ncbi:hypothetical protein [Halococcus agarilyticus]|uniref:hypothetical protein n=1 Tax=Halococcus agarilyticus TaxID=1232219 RepID=UPI0012AB8A2F|nr:hypothetical protein [Halococcus agarilyticus]
MSEEPYRLVGYQKDYAYTGKAPEESTYRDHELREPVQSKADMVDDRIDALWSDVTLTNRLTDVTIGTRYSPHDLGCKFGEIAASLLSVKDSENSICFYSEFLTGIVEEIDEKAVPNMTVSPVEKEYIDKAQFRNELLESVQKNMSTQLKNDLEDSHDRFRSYQESGEKREEVQNHIRKILENSGYDPSEYIVNKLYYTMVALPRNYPINQSNLNAKELVSESEILQAVEEEQLVERSLLRTQVSDDIDRLQKDWKNLSPRDVFEYVALQNKSQVVPKHEVVRKFKDETVTIAVLNDLAGIPDRRNHEYIDRVFEDAPLLQKRGRVGK